jgi:hypothetical protein
MSHHQIAGQRLKYTKLWFYLFCMVVKFGLSHQGRNIRVFENRMLRRTFGFKRAKITGC